MKSCLLKIRPVVTIMIIIIVNNLLAINPFETSIEPGSRENGNYRVWVFFKDKGYTEQIKKINLTPKIQKRRARSGASKNTMEYYDQLVSRNYKEEIEGSGLKILNESRWLNAVSVLGTKDQIANLSEFSFIEKIQPVHRSNRKKLFEQQSVPKTTVMDSTFYGNSYSQLNQLNIIPAHEAGYFGQGVRILVLDTGFNLSHSAFNFLNVIKQYDFINSDNITSNQEEDGDASSQHNHGTTVLSVLAGYLPGKLIGPAYEAEFLLGKTEDVMGEYIGEEDNFVAGLEWGEANGADIVTASLGYIDWYSSSDLDGKTAITTVAINVAFDLGMLCINAAGNEGNSGIIAPADAFSVISVGALDEDGNVVSFSSRGPTADGRIKPELCARGYYTVGAVPGTDDRLGYYNGTSLATPLIAGAAAVVWSAKPALTNLELRTLLMENGSNSNSPNNEMGWGIPDIYQSIKLVPNWAGPELSESAVIIPNPVFSNAVNEINIWYNMDHLSNGEIFIYNILGKEMAHRSIPGGKGMQTFDLNIQGYPSGVYLVKIEQSSMSSNENKSGKPILGKFVILH